MPTVTIDDRTVEVPSGTNLIEAGWKAGVQIPHYCYHPRLSVVGQCRMCLVKVDGMPKLQAACTTPVMKDGMVVRMDDPEVRAAQEGIMEFFLINHPLDCPICDQAGECALQDYSFKHGQAFSRFAFEEKRTYPGRERIPLGPNVLLNMNRCIQCTRCIRFTQEVSRTGELGFFERGARTEIGVFPGKRLDNHLATCTVDICPVGALTSTRFRFAERVWYLDKKPSICTGCDAGCNITVEHRRGSIRRYKPRFNPAVNDYWMCEHGRASFERHQERERLAAPRLRRAERGLSAASWKDGLEELHRRLRMRHADQAVAFLGSGFLSTEEAFALAALADAVGSPHRSLWVEPGGGWTIPNPRGGITGGEAAPNRRGAELAGMVVRSEAAISARDLVQGDGAARCSLLVVADADLGAAAHDPAAVERLRRAGYLAVLAWEDGPLARAADLALPVATHAERQGTFLNCDGQLQRFVRAFPPPGEARPTLEVLTALLARFDPSWQGLDAAGIFRRLAAAVPAFAGLDLRRLPAHGVRLEAEAARVEGHEPLGQDTRA